MAAAAGCRGSVAISSFLSSSGFAKKSQSSSRASCSMIAGKQTSSCAKFRCSAIQETPAAAVAAETKEEKDEKKEDKEATTTEAKPAAAETKEEKDEREEDKVATTTAAKPAAAKPAAKAPAKPLPAMMEEDVIPSLTSILGSQEDITQLDLKFEDNTLEGSFLKKDIPHTFWAFFPDGVVTGPRGFSLSSYCQGVSTVEPFLIDEKKITDRHIVFWVEKRLAAQGIIPVWTD